jgi:hypothetical protein
MLEEGGYIANHTIAWYDSRRGTRLHGFGHTDDNGHFWQQMDYLTPELLRILAPGRIFACHVKDRINFGNVTGAGIPTVSPFHVEAILHAHALDEIAELHDAAHLGAVVSGAPFVHGRVPWRAGPWRAVAVPT